MVKHIVMWRLKDSFEGKGKKELAREVREKLETLTRNVPGLLMLEVGDNFDASEGASDLVLTTAFKDRGALMLYNTHPEHEKVKPYVKERVTERRVVDFEV